MKALSIGIAIIAVTLCVCASEPQLQAKSQTARNGGILEAEDAFPCKNYEQWIERAGEMKFDEARVRAQFPPATFQEFKTRLPQKVDSYEEFLGLMKRRFEAMHKGDSERKAELRRLCSAELFQGFNETVDCRRVLYASDGLKIEGFILKPRSLPAERLPVVIYNHGGNPRIGSIDDSKLLHLSWLVRAGYVVVASQYRGCGDSEGNDEIGGADVADVLNLIPLIESLPYADSSRIGVFAWSRGGIMTYRALSQSDRIAAAVIGAGPTDLFAEVKRRPEIEHLLEHRIPGYSENKDAILKSRSARFWPDKLCKTSPLLLMQGSDDQNCAPRSALEMALLLEQCGRPFRLIFFESGSHSLLEHGQEVKQQTLQWFEKYLTKKPETKTNQ
jgi:pimeloyl-ACP methyl ester carboxylesterase